MQQVRQSKRWIIKSCELITPQVSQFANCHMPPSVSVTPRVIATIVRAKGRKMGWRHTQGHVAVSSRISSAQITNLSCFVAYLSASAIELNSRCFGYCWKADKRGVFLNVSRLQLRRGCLNRQNIYRYLKQIIFIFITSMWVKSNSRLWWH